jgi:hypothetical protein
MSQRSANSHDAVLGHEAPKTFEILKGSVAIIWFTIRHGVADHTRNAAWASNVRLR